MKQRVWQIAAGETGRKYPELFLKHDLMFIGPGSAGEFDYEKYRQTYGGRGGLDIITQMRLFHQEIQAGDIVLLRNGYKVDAIGLAADEGYKWDDTFDDVYGWDLQHTRRVIWQHQLKRELESAQTAGGLFAGRKQIPTFTGVQDEKVLGVLSPFFESCEKRPLASKPLPIPKPLMLDELGGELFAKGLPNDAVDEVLSALSRQRRLSTWYNRNGEECGRPSEHEVVAHMILPLLLALGWSEQLLAVEWGRIDLAAFQTTPTVAKNCVMVCEAKSPGQGLQNILFQAFHYVDKHELTACKRVLLTQGDRFYLYNAQVGSEREKPIGYLNIHNIRTRHIVPENTNAVDTIIALTPTGVARG